MSFGFGVGDFLAVGTLAWNVYRACKGSTESFRSISGELLSLHAVLKESEETLFKPPPPPATEARLKMVLEECNNVLSDLQALVQKYENLGSKTKVTWDRIKWRKEDIAEIRARLTSNVALLTAFISISQASTKVKLDKFVEEYQQGRRESTIISTQTVDSLSADERVVWRNIRKDLEGIGITVAAFEANRDFIFHWLSHAIETGAFEEQSAPDSENELLPELPSASSDSTAHVESNKPSSDASTEVYSSTEHHTPHPSGDQSLPSSAKSKLPMIPTISSRTASLDLSFYSQSSSVILPASTEPFVSCERCGKFNIAYTLHMRCERCNDGTYDICLECWRLGRGCLNWYGFGQKALDRWNRNVRLKSACYPKLVENGQISEVNGPKGWRRCLENHRMITASFGGPPMGRRYIVVKDVVGGHPMNESVRSHFSGEYRSSRGISSRVLALWSYWPEENDHNELAFPKGAEIRECVNINDGWFWGIYSGRMGLFPGNYCKEIIEGSARLNELFDEKAPVATA